MKTRDNEPREPDLPILQGILPISWAQVPAEIIAGITYNGQTGIDAGSRIGGSAGSRGA